MSCNCCLQVNLSQCQDGFTINGNLTPAAEYRVIVTGKQGAYEASFTADANGEIVVEPASYPAGLFNPYAGPLTIEVYLGDVKQDMRLAMNYDCVELAIVPGTFINDQIGLPDVVL